MGIRDWMNVLGKPQAPAGPAAPEPETARWREALTDFGFPYDLVSGATVDAAFASAQETGRRDGFVPLVVVPGHWTSTLCAPDRRCQRARELLQVPVDGKQYLADLLRELQDEHERDPDGPGQELFDQLQPTASGPAVTGIAIAKRYVAGTTRPWDQVAIVRVPAASAEEIPVYFSFEWNGWNGTPVAQMMVAVARHWRQACGAELVAMGPDLLEFSVSRPPPDHASAVALLKEHYVFASEGYEFDRAVLEPAAAQLRVNKSWVFWWD